MRQARQRERSEWRRHHQGDRRAESPRRRHARAAQQPVRRQHGEGRSRNRQSDGHERRVAHREAHAEQAGPHRRRRDGAEPVPARGGQLEPCHVERQLVAFGEAHGPPREHRGGQTQDGEPHSSGPGVHQAVAFRHAASYRERYGLL